MKKIIISIALLTNVLCAFGQTPIEKFSRVRVDMHDHQPVDLARLGIEVDHGVWEKGVSFTHELSASELSLLRQSGFKMEVLIDDLAQHFMEQNRNSGNAELRGSCGSDLYPYKTPIHYHEGSMAGYFTYNEMLKNLDSMRILYPNLISTRKPISDTLTTFEGRPVYWLRISDNADTDETTEPEVFYNALHHAREPNSLSQLLFYMWYLLENYATNPEIKYLVDNTAMYFVPCVNPDGYIYNETTNPFGGGFWRKNRRKNSDNTIGVDLNRNYGFNWGFNNDGSSPTPSSEVYRGTAPFSEPETRLISLLSSQRKFQLALNYHTYGNLFIYPWSYNDSPTADSQIFNGFSEVMLRESAFRTGTSIQTVGYNVNGDVVDWMYGDVTTKPKIFGFTPEVGSSNFGFWPPKTIIDQYNKSTLATNLTAAHLLLNYGLATDETPQYLTSKTGFFSFNLKRYGLKSGNLTVTLTASTPNVVPSAAAKTYNLTQFQSIKDSFSFICAENIKVGDSVCFVLTVSNGLYARSETFCKIFGTPTRLFNFDGNQTTLFQRGGTWGTTSNKYFSYPLSMTDSPNGLYTPSSVSAITTVNPLSIAPQVSRAMLRFRATWETESEFDYVEPRIELDGNGVFIPICGKWTRTHPTTGKPVYDGNQARWLLEEFDLTPYAGRQVRWQFTIKSNSSIELDGFYFDDMELVTTTPSGTSTQQLTEKDFILKQNYPNPTTNTTVIDIDGLPQNAQLAQLIVTDVAGKTIYSEALQSVDNQKIMLNTEGWAQGIYFYQIEINGQRTAARQFVKL